MPDTASSTVVPPTSSDAATPPGRAEPASPWKPRLLFAARLIIAMLLVGWLIKSGRFEPSAMLRVHSPLALLGAVLCQVVMIIGITLRWPLVMWARGLDMPLGPGFRIGLAGQFAAVWTPAGLGLDAARTIDGTRRFASRKADVFKAAALDRVCAVIALAFVCVPGGLWLILCKVAGKGQVGGSATAICALYSAVVLAACGALYAVKRTRPWAGPFILALVVHVANAGAIVLCFAAQGGNVTFEGLAFAAPLVVLSSIIPLTPLGIGVTDGAAAELFFLALMPGAAAATMLARATSVVLALLCGALSMGKTRTSIAGG